MADRLLSAAEEFVEAVARSTRMKRKEQTARRLELGLRKAFQEQGRQFERGMRQFKDRFPKIKESVAANEWMFVFHIVAQKTSKLFSEPIDAAVSASLTSGAKVTLGDLGLKVSFDLKNPRAVKFLQDYGAKKVAEIDDTTRDYLQTLITQATEEGWSYDRTAQAIIDRYKDFAIGKPQEHIDSRAHGIAVTETGNAYAEGQLQVAKDMQDAGLEMEKAWSTVGDSKVNQFICAPNEEQGWIPLDQAFQSGHMRPLGHPYCRCDMFTRVKPNGESK